MPNIGGASPGATDEQALLLHGQTVHDNGSRASGWIDQGVREAPGGPLCRQLIWHRQSPDYL